MIADLKKERPVRFMLEYFIIWTIWWIVIFLLGIREHFLNYSFAATYGFMAAWGGIWGLKISKRWGGYRSAMGKAILFFSLGLFAEEFGQVVFSFYNIFLKVEIPYPSIADIGYFANIPFYIFGITYLAKAAGIKFSLKKISSKIQLIVFPLLLLVLSYFFFLKDYSVDLSDPLKVFLDFGYPLGQSIYISLALLTYSLSKDFLGGIMKKRVLFIIFAFVCQYLADFNFLYQNSRGTWYNGGYGDYLYFFAYAMMAFGLFQLNIALNKLD